MLEKIRLAIEDELISRRDSGISFPLSDNGLVCKWRDGTPSNTIRMGHVEAFKIAFDVDGTLIDYSGQPRQEIIDILKTLSKLPNTYITVWSGGGKPYAKNIVSRLGLEEFVTIVTTKYGVKKESVDICFDDEDVHFGKVNVKV